MSDSMTLAERLKALGEKATPGPWDVSEHQFPDPPFEGQLEREHGIYPPLGESGPVALLSGPRNAELIVALRNALPELLAALEDSVRLDAIERADVVIALPAPSSSCAEPSWIVRNKDSNGFKAHVWITGKPLRELIDAARPTACATKGDGNGW
jgi:hypothetical protein